MPLVAVRLSFDHPKSGKALSFEIPWPKEFEYENLSN
jgi:23S rRNA-/tRNA-specific pseudouridylate synthase